MALSRRLAIIPGGLGGLGSATGRKLRQQGARIAVLYAPFERSRRDELLRTRYDQDYDESEIRTYECDITSPDSVRKAFSDLTEENTTGPSRTFPSILVNAAGYVALSNLEDTEPEDTIKHLHDNILGPMLCSQAFAKLYFAASKAAESSPSPAPPGRIVSIASQAAHFAMYRHAAYCASKAGLLGLVRSMASEWGGRGITSNSISPTVVWTEMGKKAWSDDVAREAYLKRVPAGKFALPGEIADHVSFLCQDSSGMINGADLRVDGGYTTG